MLYLRNLKRLTQKYNVFFDLVEKERMNELKAVKRKAEKSVEEYVQFCYAKSCFLDLSKKGVSQNSQEFKDAVAEYGSMMEKRTVILETVQKSVEEFQEYIEKIERHLLKQMTKEEIETLEITTSGLFSSYFGLLFEKKEGVYTVTSQGKTRKLSESEWMCLMEKVLPLLSVLSKSTYWADVLDGVQWSIKITAGKQTINFFGSNDFPPNWTELWGLFEPFFSGE